MKKPISPEKWLARRREQERKMNERLAAHSAARKAQGLHLSCDWTYPPRAGRIHRPEVAAPEEKPEADAGA